MMVIKDSVLIERAKEVSKLKKISEDIEFGSVGCALVTDKGNVYVGASIHVCCGIGFCAEHSAIASMITNREYKIDKIVAVSAKSGKILPPCGRCRELMRQINKKNENTKIIIGKNRIATLKELLPEPWQKDNKK